MLEIFFYPENGTESFDEVKVFRKNAVREDIVQMINFCEENISKYPVRKTFVGFLNKILARNENEF